MRFAALNAPYDKGRLDGANFAAQPAPAGTKPRPAPPLSKLAFTPRPPAQTVTPDGPPGFTFAAPRPYGARPLFNPQNPQNRSTSGDTHTLCA